MVVGDNMRDGRYVLGHTGTGSRCGEKPECHIQHSNDKAVQLRLARQPETITVSAQRHRLCAGREERTRQA